MLHPTLKLSKNSDIFDLIINTLAIEIEWDDYLGLLGLDGTIVVVGIPEKQTPLDTDYGSEILLGLSSAEFERPRKCLISVASTTLLAI